MKKKFKRILIFSLSNIGDVVMTLPVGNILKSAYPEAKLFFIVGPKAKGLFDGQDFYDEVIVYDKKAAFREKIHFLSRVRGLKADLLIDLKKSFLPFLLFPISSNFRFLKKRNTPTHHRDQHLSELDFLNLPSCETHRFSLFQKSDLVSLFDKISPFLQDESEIQDTLIIAPSARFWFKSWPKEKFVKLIDEILHKRPKQKILLTGAPEEAAISEELAQVDSGRILSLAGKLTLHEFAALLSHAKQLICHDSAAMHIAEYVGCPHLSLFGPTDPAKYGYQSTNSQIIFRSDLPCRPCEKASCPTERECLTELGIEAVLPYIK